MIETATQSVITGTMMGIIYALIALGLSIIFGVMNVVNFAHGDFVMLAMYLSFTVGTLFAWDAVITPVITVPLLFVFGLITYYLLIDRTLRQMYVVQLAVTVGLQILMRSAALIIWQAQPRALQYSFIQGNIEIGPYSILTSRLVGAVVSLIFIGGIAYFLNKTWSGKAMRAASDDLDVASLMGVNYHRTYALTFAIGAALTAVAGGLLMSFQQTDPQGGVRFGLLSWCVLALAGLGSLPGLIVSGIIVGIAETFAISFIDPRARLLAVYAIFILVLWLRPRGLFGRK
ncbi:MAG: branched-chain amino acid ABC transporter permease [Chloroflexi bacterium]|nr:branched-chain amino acid ABC transporter permease [Chloroflexota bacterium]